jgi:hypothetical protein
MQSVIQQLQGRLGDLAFRQPAVGHKEWTDQEKVDDMRRLLQSDPDVFLQRWGGALDAVSLAYFEGLHDADVDAVLHTLQNNVLGDKRALVRNRRLQFLNAQTSTFLSHEEMRRRAPELYESHVGRYLTKEEKYPPFEPSVGLVDRMYYDLDEFANDPAEEDSEVEELEEEEKQALLDEFKRLMMERFLDGQEAEFDYTSVDNNAAYDDLQAQELDLHEEYFEEGVAKDAVQETWHARWNQAQSSQDEYDY